MFCWTCDQQAVNLLNTLRHAAFVLRWFSYLLNRLFLLVHPVLFWKAVFCRLVASCSKFLVVDYFSSLIFVVLFLLYFLVCCNTVTWLHVSSLFPVACKLQIRVLKGNFTDGFRLYIDHVRRYSILAKLVHIF